MSFPLSLRPWPRKEADAESLESIIKRIHNERGHFKNVTEASLQEEIANPELEEAKDGLAHDQDEKLQDADARRKEIYAARAEMLKQVGQAQNEALIALDFLSLLISKDSPIQADLSMSPHLKQTIPVGTLGFDKSQASKLSKADEDNAKAVSMGWTLQSLNSAADKLLNSATRLGKEMEKEACFWEQILSVSEKGWSVCRMPREGHTVGVRFGFSEAAPMFGTRGLAALRPNSDGSIILDQGLSNEAKSVRVRILRGGQTLGTSPITSPVNGAQAPLESMIHQARDSLFEEELFQELMREARSLLSFGIRITENIIHIPARPESLISRDIILPSPYELVVDLVKLGERPADGVDGPATHLAETFAVALRILLTNAYRRKFRLRSLTPKPLSDDKRPPPVQEILRPVLCYLQHDYYVRSLQGTLSDLAGTLRSAQLAASISAIKSEPEADLDKRTSLTRMESIVLGFSAPLNTNFVFSLPQVGIHSINVTTSLFTPTYGTSFQLNLPSLPSSSGLPKVLEFGDFTQLHQHITQLAGLGVSKYIVEQSPTWTVEDNGCDVRKVFVSKGKTKRLSVVLQQRRLALLGGWIGEQPAVLGVWQTPATNSRKSLLEVVMEASSSPQELSTEDS